MDISRYQDEYKVKPLVNYAFSYMTNFKLTLMTSSKFFVPKPCSSHLSLLSAFTKKSEKSNVDLLILYEL